jgi:hypothetical protein
MGIRTRNNSQAEARKRFQRAQEAWQAGQPRRCKTNLVGAMGECLACDAEQGVSCQFDAMLKAREGGTP